MSRTRFFVALLFFFALNFSLNLNLDSAWPTLWAQASSPVSPEGAPAPEPTTKLTDIRLAVLDAIIELVGAAHQFPRHHSQKNYIHIPHFQGYLLVMYRLVAAVLDDNAMVANIFTAFMRISDNEEGPDNLLLPSTIEKRLTDSLSLLRDARTALERGPAPTPEASEKVLEKLQDILIDVFEHLKTSHALVITSLHEMRSRWVPEPLRFLADVFDGIASVIAAGVGAAFSLAPVGDSPAGEINQIQMISMNYVHAFVALVIRILAAANPAIDLPKDTLAKFYLWDTYHKEITTHEWTGPAQEVVKGVINDAARRCRGALGSLAPAAATVAP